ncbi:hypothetical protein ACFOY8_11895 [Thalassospira xianhensis]|nr:hypothetical protein [Thalassospira xianhensis]
MHNGKHELVSRFPISFKDHIASVVVVKTVRRASISIPTQVGCPVKCSFCISTQQPYRRHLHPREMMMAIHHGYENVQPGVPVTVAFSGEGDACLNARAVAEVAQGISNGSMTVDKLRFSTSGANSRAIEVLANIPARKTLQLSLHSAVQSTRRRLIPVSDGLDGIASVFRRRSGAFDGIRLNYVLMRGINDTPEEIEALKRWGNDDWLITLSPLMGNRALQLSAEEVSVIADRLVASGRRVRVFKDVGRKLDETNYPLLTYQERQPMQRM